MSTQSQTVKATAQGSALDVSAMTASVLCALHCAALPLVVGLLPASLLWVKAEWVHQLFVLLAVPLSGYAIVKSFQNKAHTGFIFAASIGLTLLVAAAFFETLHDFETPLTLAGAALLLVAHLLRWLASRSISRCPTQNA